MFRLTCLIYSFPADTLVHSEEGKKPISEVKVGDKVLSFDERTQKTLYQPVMAVIQGERQYQMVKLTLASGESIEATAEHPFYLKGKGWNPASSLKVGQALQLHNGTTVVINEIDTSSRVEKVYNLTVANTHNYFVGVDGVLVHNKDDCFIVSSKGTVLPPHKDYNLVDSNIPTNQGGDWLQIHRNHSHKQMMNPHTHYPQLHNQRRQLMDRETTGTDIDNADTLLRNGSMRQRRNRQDLGGTFGS